MKLKSLESIFPSSLPLLTAAILTSGGTLIAAPDDNSLVVSVPEIDPRQYSSSVLKSAANSPLKEQREFLFLYQKVGNTKMIEGIAEVILEDHPRDAEALELVARTRLRQGRIPEARELAGRFKEVAPGGESEELFLDVVIASADYETALALLTEMKQRVGVGKPFRFQEDLADVYFRMGEKDASLAAYREIIETPGYSVLLRKIAQRELDVVAADEDFRQAMQHMTMREVSAARVIHGKMKQAYPLLEPTLVLGAVLDGNDGALEEAIAALNAVGESKYRYTVSPYSTELAMHYLEAGREHKAEALLRVAAVAPTIPIEQQKIAMKVLSDLYADIRPHVSAELVAEDFSEGLATRLHVDSRTAIDQKTGVRLGARVSAHDVDSISLSVPATSATGEISDTQVGLPSGDRVGVELYAEKIISGGPTYRLGAGFEGEKPIWSAQVGEESHLKREHWRAAYSGNKVPLDSLALEAADAREHRIEAEIARELADRVRGVVGVHGRTVRVGGGTLGAGGGANLELEYLLHSKDRSWATVSYFAEYQGFDGSGGGAGRAASSVGFDGGDGIPVDSLILDSYHVHGVKLFGEHAFSESFVGNGTLGLGYRFDSSEVEVRAGGGFSYYLNFNTRLALDAMYFSSGASGVSSSSGGEGFRASVGLHHAF